MHRGDMTLGKEEEEGAKKRGDGGRDYLKT